MVIYLLYNSVKYNVKRYDLPETGENKLIKVPCFTIEYLDRFGFSFTITNQRTV